MVTSRSPVNLSTASVVVACGAGVRTDGEFRLVQELAGCLGAAIAGTRPAVDRGFISHEQMIGQTGVSVRPEVYIAIGISGATQHRTGMERSARIIAINSDPDAAIFSIADHGIIGDLKNVIPRMIAACKAGATTFEQLVQSTE